MPFGGALIGGGLALGALGSLGGAYMASNAQRDAANTQLQGTQLGIAAQERMYNQSRQDMAPFMANDLSARQQMLGSINAGTDDPYYQRLWGITQRRLNGVSGANGTFGAGAWQKRMADSAMGLQSEQLHDRYQRLGQLFGNTGGQQASLSAQTGNQLGGLYQQGYGAAGGMMGQAGATWGQGVAGAAGNLGNGAMLGGMYAAYQGGGLGGSGALYNNTAMTPTGVVPPVIT